MKKLIFTLLIAFITTSLAVNAQSSSNLNNNHYSTNLKQQLQKVDAKLNLASDAKEIENLNNLKLDIEGKIKAHNNNVDDRTATTKTNNNKLTRAKQPVAAKPILKKAEIKVEQKEDLLSKAKQMNLDFAKKGLPFKTQVKTFAGGKQYIEIVDLPLQNGITPTQSKQ